MGKRASVKRFSSMPDAASKAIDIKARKRIEELYELTDEIINAYNEVNETYVNKVYRKYKQLQEVNKKLKQQLNRHHCSGCQCTILPNDNTQNEDEKDAEEEDDDIEDTDSSILDEEDKIYEQTGKSGASSTTTRSIITRSKKNNAFLIPDIEDTQNFDVNDSRLSRKSSSADADNQDGVSMVTNQNENEITHDDNQSEHEEEEADKNNDEHAQEEEDEEEEEEDGDDEDMDSLPLTLQDIIRKKAEKNKNAKIYLLEIPRYPALCEFLRDRSRTSFDHRPSENQVRPLIANHLSQQMANDAKIRMRLRDELREIHRSYMRTFMNDPHANVTKISFHKHKRLNIKRSPI